MIDCHLNIIENCNKEIKYFERQMTASAPHDISSANMDGMPHGNFSPVSLDKAVDEIRHNECMIEIEEAEIKRLRTKKKEIEDIAKEFEGLYLKVAVMKHIEQKPLQRIADELGYSVGYIQNVSAIIDKGEI